MTTGERERFEAWHQRKYGWFDSLDHPAGPDPIVRKMWDAWQAAIAAQPERAREPVAWMVVVESASGKTGGTYHTDTRDKAEQYATFVFGADCKYALTPLYAAPVALPDGE